TSPLTARPRLSQQVSGSLWSVSPRSTSRSGALRASCAICSVAARSPSGMVAVRCKPLGRRLLKLNDASTFIPCPAHGKAPATPGPDKRPDTTKSGGREKKPPPRAGAPRGAAVREKKKKKGGRRPPPPP